MSNTKSSIRIYLFLLDALNKITYKDILLNALSIFPLPVFQHVNFHHNHVTAKFAVTFVVHTFHVRQQE
jgi:hypothetical protein